MIKKLHTGDTIIQLGLGRVGIGTTIDDSGDLGIVFETTGPAFSIGDTVTPDSVVLGDSVHINLPSIKALDVLLDRLMIVRELLLVDEIATRKLRYKQIADVELNEYMANKVLQLSEFKRRSGDK